MRKTALVALGTVLLAVLSSGVASAGPVAENVVTLAAPFGAYITVREGAMHLMLRTGPGEDDFLAVWCPLGDPSGCDELNAGDFVKIKGRVENYRLAGDDEDTEIFSRIIPLVVERCDQYLTVCYGLSHLKPGNRK